MLPNTYFLQGANAIFWNKYQTYHVSNECPETALTEVSYDSYSSGSEYMDCSTAAQKNMHWRGINHLLELTLEDKQRPALIFGVLNGRDSTSDHTPSGITGSLNDLRELMIQVSVASAGHMVPVDMFLLVAQKPDARMMQNMTAMLPRGSVVAVVETSAESHRQCDFWELMQQSSYLRLNKPEAHSLLATYLMTGTPTRPDDASLYVSGMPHISLRQLWMQTCANDLIRSQVNAFIERMTPYCTDATIEAIGETAQFICNDILDVNTPSDTAIHYGLSILNEWDQHVAPLRAFANAAAPRAQQESAMFSIVQAPTKPKVGAEADITPGRNTGALGRQTRLTSDQLATLPPNLRRVASVRPNLFKKIVS